MMPASSDYVAFYLPLDAVFPQADASIGSLRDALSGVSRADALLWASKINLVLGAPSALTHAERQQWGLALFDEQQLRRVNRYARQCGGVHKVFIFGRGPLVELIRWTSLLAPDSPDERPPGESPEHCFVLSALIAAETWHAGITEGRFGLGDDLDARRGNSLAAVRTLREAAIRAPHLALTFGRASLLFEKYLPLHYPDFGCHFSQATGLSVSEYLTCCFSLAAHSLTPDVNCEKEVGDHLIWDWRTVASRSAYADRFDRYLDVTAQSPRELRLALWGDREWEDIEVAPAPRLNLRPLRNRPILRLEDGRAVIMDPVLFSDCASASPLFLAARHAPSAQRLFGAFGDAFEDYILDLFREIEGAGSADPQFHPNVEVAVGGRLLEIDGCLFEPGRRRLFLFEIKGKWVDEDKVLSDDVTDYLKLIRKKYVDGDGKERGAIQQLAEFVRAIQSPGFESSQYPFLTEASRVIPVFVTSDRLLAGPLECNFFARQFRDLLANHERGSEPADRGNHASTDPLILLTVQDIENLAATAEKNPVGELLGHYSDSHLERLVDFDMYLRERGAIAGHSRNVHRAGVEFMETATRSLFPKKSDA